MEEKEIEELLFNQPLKEGWPTYREILKERDTLKQENEKLKQKLDNIKEYTNNYKKWLQDSDLGLEKE